MNSLNKVVNFNYNDHGSYLAPFGTMLSTMAVNGGRMDSIATFVSVLVDQLGAKVSEKLEEKKEIINKSIAALTSTAAVTALNSYMPTSVNTIALNYLANGVCGIGVYKAVEALAPTKIIPYVRLPLEVGVSTLVGMGITNLLNSAGVPQETTFAAGGFLTMLATCSLALNDLVYSRNTSTQAPGANNRGPFHYIVRDLSKVRTLKDGRVMIPVSNPSSQPKTT